MDPVVDKDCQENLSYARNLSCYREVLVTGANGMLGSYAVEALCETSRLLGLSLSITAISRNFSSYLTKLANHYPGTLKLANWHDLQSTIHDCHAPLVIHAASPASPEKHSTNPIGLIETNVNATMVIASALSKTGGHCVFLSSGEVYGTTPYLPTSEDSYSPLDHLANRGTYGEAKRAGELILKSYSESHRFGATCLRVYHTFGPGIDLSQTRIFSTVVAALIASRPIILRSSGAAKRSFLYSADLFSAVLTSSQLTGFQALNVAGESEISILDFANIAAGLSGGRCSVVVEGPKLDNHQAEISESPIMRGLADTTRLNALGWKQSVPIDVAISRTTSSCRWRSLWRN